MNREKGIQSESGHFMVHQLLQIFSLSVKRYGKVTLCPPPCEPECPSECPEVEITNQGVTIGEDGNRVRLTPAQWNDLVSRIRHGELPPVQ